MCTCVRARERACVHARERESDFVSERECARACACVRARTRTESVCAKGGLAGRERSARGKRHDLGAQALGAAAVKDEEAVPLWRYD